MLENQMNDAKNVLGTALKLCCKDPLTGFYRDGFCNTGPKDKGSHVIAAVLTKQFLDFTKSKGNDLTTPKPQSKFPGLKPGDHWCLCAIRWKQAMLSNVAPKVRLQATHQKALQFVTLENLKAYQYTPWSSQ